MLVNQEDQSNLNYLNKIEEKRTVNYQIACENKNNQKNMQDNNLRIYYK